jgi:hypothetical protein
VYDSERFGSSGFRVMKTAHGAARKAASMARGSRRSRDGPPNYSVFGTKESARRRFFRRKTKYGGLEISDAQRLR